jgi:hypothetical protein
MRPPIRPYDATRDPSGRLFQWRSGDVLFVFNEGGRGFTLSVYRRPFAARVYLAGRAWAWGS